MKLKGCPPDTISVPIVDFDSSGSSDIIDFGVVITEKAKKKEVTNFRVINDDKARLEIIFSDINKIIVDLTPDIMVMEGYSPRPGLGKGWKAALGFAVLLGLSFSHKLSSFIFIPQDIKRHVAGNLKASKDEVALRVQEKYNVKFIFDKKMTISFTDVSKKSLNLQHPNYQEHISDSLALALLGYVEYIKISNLFNK